jgi:hypothetical protein
MSGIDPYIKTLYYAAFQKMPGFDKDFRIADMWIYIEHYGGRQERKLLEKYFDSIFKEVEIACADGNSTK